MAINPLFILVALLACAVLISAADLYKILDRAYDTQYYQSKHERFTSAWSNSGQVCIGTRHKEGVQTP
jgi:hypothetical protein